MKTSTLLPVVVLLNCTPQSDPPEALDLVGPFASDEARAGVVLQPAALIGGAAGEGQLGDILLVNDRARFVIQGIRDGGGLARQGGGVIDADLVRPPGQPDRDLIHDWMALADISHLSAPTAIEIVDDGLLTGTAHVRVTGTEAPLDYLAGAFEDPSTITNLGLTWVTDYVLEAGTPLMAVTTSVTASEAIERVSLGDVINNVPGVGDPWAPGLGRTPSVPDATPWLAYVDQQGGYTLGLFRDPADLASPNAGLDILNFLIAMLSLYGDPVAIDAGATATWARWYGVASDPAALTDAWLAALGTPTEAITATVTSDGAPVAGARVTVLVDDLPYTLALSRADGTIAVQVPQGSAVSLVADGSGDRIVRDIPAGAGRFGPVSHADKRAAAIASMRDGGAPVPHARGLGRTTGDPGGTLELAPPAMLTLRSGDSLPFEARLRPTEPLPDDGLGLPLPDGGDALVYAIDGVVEVPLEAGTYRLVAHRGPRYEAVEQQVTLTAGEALTVDLALTEVVVPDGWFSADTHIHAAPSSDGKLSMTDRLLVSAGTGVQLHVATDHDSLADYAPLAEALGLDDVLTTIAGVEVSPLARGHANVFPVQPKPQRPSGGALRWWLEPFTNTTDHFERVRAQHPDAVVQINHPFSPGMPQFAGWRPGEIRRGDFWWDGMDALEVVTSNRWVEPLPLYLDLTNRGVLVAPMGNTDSHTHRANSPGLNVTWVGIDVDDVGDVTGELFAEAIRARRTIATNGPTMTLSIDPGSIITAPASLQVTTTNPSWIVIDEIALYVDGVETEVAAGTSATFTLDAPDDAAFVVIARGATGMDPVAGHRPWAMASAILLDHDDDGWDPPLPPLDVQ